MEKKWVYLFNEIDWDLFIVVITGTDRLMHFCYDAYLDESDPRHEAYFKYFSKVDEFVGNIYSRYRDSDNYDQEKDNFYMLSDHGFTNIKTEVYLNNFLHENAGIFFWNGVTSRK